MAELSAKSSGSNVPKAVRHNCTAPCSFQMSFNDQFQRPSNCLERISSFQCVVEIYIFYSTRNIVISFKTSGSEYGLDSVTIIAAQEVFHNFNSNETFYATEFSCLYGDDCDWSYTHNVISRCTKIHYTLILNDLRSLLYDSSNSSVSQCYSQTNMVSCNSGLCSSIVYENSTNINRSCDYMTNDSVGIDILRIGLYPGPTIYDQNYFIYRCNENLCNSPTIENLVQAKIWSSASSFNAFILSEADSISKNNTHYWIMLLMLIHFM